jgi:hypothetical protein
MRRGESEIMPYKNIEDRKNYSRAYEHSPQRRKYKQEYEKSPKMKIYRKKYQQSDEYKEYRKQYTKTSPVYKKYRKQYENSMGRKIYKKEYEQTPERIIYRTEYSRRYKQTPRYKELRKLQEKKSNRIKYHKFQRRTCIKYPLYKCLKCKFCDNGATEHHHYTNPIEIDKFHYVCHSCHLEQNKLRRAKYDL